MINENKNIWTNKAFVAIMACLCTALWGSATPAIKIGYELFSIVSSDIPSKLVFAGIRFVAAGLFVIVFITIKDKKFPTFKKNDILPLTGIGLIQTTLQYIFFYIGLTYTTGAKGSLFSSVSGFIVVLISPLIYKSEKLTYNKLLGCLSAIIGLILITMDSGIQEFSGFTIMGEGFVLTASCCNAVSVFLTKKLTKTRDPKTVAGAQLFIGGVVLLALGLFTGGKIYFTTYQSVVCMVYLAFLSAVAYALWNVLIANNPVSSVSMYHLFTPIFGTIISGLVLNETILTWQNFSALILVSLGVWLVNSKIFSRQNQTQNL